MFKLHIIPALKDNYIWLLSNTDNQAIIIDPSEADTVINYVKKNDLSPIGILLTHLHIDHIGGVTKLKERYNHIEVYGPSEINLPINYIDNQNTISIGNFTFDLISVPGHTSGHLAYYCHPYLFTGDALFSAGCGRVFEKTYQKMLNSLNKLKQLPDDVLICAGHEYTYSNLLFASTMLPEDENIKSYLNTINENSITLPSNLATEKLINLFLRCSDKKLQQKFKFNNELDLFIFFRSEKDNF